ncbi:uncharacterized protein [Nicotiana tomentosiformis]|uniref:uncharacterized protein isoform X2 n=1 Tax=Nicotiana tomentosiformis TaxID=4098 RepID=UPI00388C48A4
MFFRCYLISSIIRTSELGDEHQKEMMIATRSIAKRNVLDCMLGLLKSGIEEEMVCVSIAYITIGSTQRAKAVFDTGLIEPLHWLQLKKWVLLLLQFQLLLSVLVALLTPKT